MKLTLFILFLLINSSIMSQASNPDFDQTLADSLGADDYGMKSYTFVILKTGPNKIDDAEEVGRIFRGHLDNIGRLADENKLIIAGPLGKNENTYRGIFVLNVKTIAEAKELLQTDPAIKEGLLDADIYEWYGAAALPVYIDVQKKITKENP
jgi:uncharacterized protein YciI